MKYANKTKVKYNYELKYINEIKFNKFNKLEIAYGGVV